MVVQICPEGQGRLSFRSPRKGEVPIKIRVPDGSEVLPIRGLGDQLFVPSSDPCQRHACAALDVLRKARAGREGFHIL